MGVTFKVDHVTPRSAGSRRRGLAAGGEEAKLDHLFLCCLTCSRHKSTRPLAPDPATGKPARLFVPLRDAWQDHFEWQKGATLIAGLTPCGRATAAALQMNRPEMVELRRYWVAAGRHPPLP